MRCAVLLALLLSGCDPAPPVTPPVPLPPRLTVHGHDVYWEHEGTSVNLTRFERPNHLYHYDLSPDGETAFVWHMVKSPRLLTLYSTTSLKRTAQFAPGFGGDLCWTPFNTLLHIWGAGTSCFNHVLYDRTGKQLWLGQSMGYEVSSCGRYLAMEGYGRGGPLVQVLDLKTLRMVYDRQWIDIQAGLEIRWSGKSLIVTAETRQGETLTRSVGRAEFGTP